MPNWCNTEIVYEGKNVQKLLADWNNSQEMHMKASSNWLGRLFIYNNIKDDSMPYCRSFVQDINLDLVNNLYMCTEDAWAPMVSAYNKIADIYGISYVYKAEEPGSEVFVNTDISGKYFPERYYLEFSYDGEKESNFLNTMKELDEERYFTSFEEISKSLSVYNIKTPKDMENFSKYINRHYEKCYICFHEYKKEI